MSINHLSKYDELRKGDYLWSNNKEYKAVFEEDGNFVIYGWKPVWSSDTAGQCDAFRLCMQDDGNLVMYKRDNNPIWHTNTHRSEGFKMCRLHLRDDGNLVIDKEGEEVWNSSQSRGMK